MVIVNEVTYNQITEYLVNYRGLTIECEEDLIKAFPELPRQTVKAIISKFGQNKLKQLYYKFSSRSDAILAE